MDPLLALAIQEAPAAIAGLKALFRHQNPDAPEPTSEEVIAAYQNALGSIAKDDRWLAAHQA